MSRREKLEAMLAENPTDQTLRYMLAMEFQSEEQPEEALRYFRELMESDAPHVPAFLMAGQLLAKTGRPEEAREIYSQGIREAQKQGNDHAAGEMTQFLHEL